MTDTPPKGHLPSAQDDALTAQQQPSTPQTMSPSYRLAYLDQDFILREELRPARLQLELLKPELLMQENQIESTVVIFGSARLRDEQTARAMLEQAEMQAQARPDDAKAGRTVHAARQAVRNSRYYAQARKLAAIISKNCQCPEKKTHVVITGGGPGIMEAANRGAHDVQAKSIGLNIVLPHEQTPNPYITPELCFQFHYFAIRKMHFLIRARALVVFPGGFGTLDELFDALTLIQTGKIAAMPILLFGSSFWRKTLNLEVLVEEGTISAPDLELITYVDSAEQAWEHIARFDNLDHGTTETE